MTDRPTFDELTARIAKLEDKRLGVDDLPMAQLQRWLSQRWLADAVADVQPKNAPLGFGFSGPWGTALPTATTGVLMCTMTNPTPALILGSSTGFVSAAATDLVIEVYLNGVLLGLVEERSTNTVNVRLTPPTGAWQTTLQAGNNYLAYRLISGSTDANDRGFAAVIF